MKEGTGELFYGALLTGIKKLAPSDIPLEASWILSLIHIYPTAKIHRQKNSILPMDL